MYFIIYIFVKNKGFYMLRVKVIIKVNMKSIFMFMVHDLSVNYAMKNNVYFGDFIFYLSPSTVI